ncbi:MAG: M56 family metallopeptidase, partial [Planctomycetaceae bacterium]
MPGSSDVATGGAGLVAVDDSGDAMEPEASSGPTFATDNGFSADETPAPSAAPTVAVLESPVEGSPQLSWTERASNALRPWLTWAVGFWGVGVVFCSLRPVMGWLTLRRLKRVGVSPVSSELVSTLGRVSKRIGVTRYVRILESTLAQVPLVVGYLRPVILLPASLVTNLPTEQLESILAHELAHIRRHDFIVNLLQVIVETLFFYHPAVWWLSHRIRIEREHCCDDLVVRTMNNRAEYGRALIAVEELRGRHTSLALGADDGSLIARIRRLAGQPKQRNGLSAASGLSVLAVLLGMAVLFGVAADQGLASADGSVPINGNDDVVEEAPLPEGSTLRFGTSRFRMGRAIDAMAVSADGVFAVAGHESGAYGPGDPDAAGFDLVTGRRAYSLPGLLGVAMSPDGKSFVAKGERTVGIHDAATGKRIRQIALPADQFAWTDVAEFTPNGQAFAVASKENMKEGVPAAVHLVNFKLGKTMRVFPLNNPETDLSATFSKVLGVAFSRDGKFMATGGYDNDRGTYFARLWDVKRGDEIRRFVHGERSHGIRSLAFSPDEMRLATRSQDGRMRLFDVATGDSIKTFEKDGGGRKPRTVAFSPDGKTLVAAGNSLRLYDTATNEERLRIDRVQVSNLHFTEGGKYLVGAGGGTIFRWDTATGEPQTPVAGDSAVSQVFVTPDDRRVITHGSLGDAHVWDAATGEHLHRFGGRWQRNIAMSQDGRFLAWAVRDETVRVQRQPFAIYGTRIRLYDVVNNKLIDRFPGSTSDASEIAFNADGKQLVTVGRRDGVVHVWNFATGKEERSFPAFPDTEKDEPNQVARAVLSPDGKTLAVRYVPYDNSIILEDGTRATRLGHSLPKPRPVRLWDMATGKMLRDIKAADGSSLLANSDPLVFAPDGHLLLVGSTAVDPARGKVVRRLPTSRTIRSAAFTPDARFLVTADSGDFIQYWDVSDPAQGWDVATWKKAKEFQAHGGTTSLCISPSGRLFSGHNDTTTLAWKSTRVPVASHEKMQPVRSKELTGVYLGEVDDYRVVLRFIGRQSKVPGQRGILEGRMDVDIPDAAIGSAVHFTDNPQTGAIDLHVGLFFGTPGSIPPGWSPHSDRPLGKVERGDSGTLYLTTYRSPSEHHYRFLRRIPLRRLGNNAQVQREDVNVLNAALRGEGVPPAMNRKELTEKAPNILDRVVWGSAIEGLQAGLLLDSPEPENRNVPLNSVVKYRVLVCNRNKKEMSFIARCLPVDFRNSPYVVPGKDIKSALAAADLPQRFRATGGRQGWKYNIAHQIKLKPGEAAVIVGHTGGDQHKLYVGNRGAVKDAQGVPRIGEIQSGSNWIVQPVQIWLPSSPGYGKGFSFEGEAWQTTIDSNGKAEAWPADRTSLLNTEGAITLFPYAGIEVGPKT